MARRWTPQRLVLLRRIRVAACAGVTVAATVGMFLFTARKTVALTVNGETTTVTTYAMSAQRLLESQGITLKTHDIVESSAGGDRITDRSVVTVRSAYQTTITIDGQRVPFWTTATSAEQLLSFFEQNEAAAAKVTVDIGNVYNKLTGGFVINENGPVTVIADGKSSEAPNGKLPAASILDAKGITLGKDDRVSVEKDGGTTILRVQRVTHGQETRTVAVPHGTQTILDPNLEPGQTEIRQQGEDGETKQVFDVTYVDGHAESETLISETTTKIAIDTIVAVGPERAQEDSGESADGGNGTTGDGSDSSDSTGDSSGSEADGSSGSKDNTGSSGTAGNGNSNSGNSGGSGDSNSGSDNNHAGNAGNSGSSSNNGSNGSGNAGSSGNNSGGNSGNSGNTSGGSNNSGNAGNSGNSSGDDSNNNSGNSGNGSNNNSGSNSGGNSGNTGNSGSSSDDGSATARLWRPTAAQAQAYAAGAAAQRGWTGDEWTALVKLWTRESNWRWSAENKWSGAYGIPQALPGSKMAAFGADWRNDAAIQIDWGLYYIAQRYGTPSEAWRHSEEVGWY
ncbi:lytic transglycosylase [Bifidobacterium hapali]|uniref:Lytic transglycosylase n=1 Tax=Bifidobacterium hapali TaxID=1630172 RepID=A0A261G5H5_9BIFI|nr:G5 domain-containing protein [Bifidobacterium hapali]OZG66679.1 lytic transglycosylase [Bifidobacterium hapali]